MIFARPNDPLCSKREFHEGSDPNTTSPLPYLEQYVGLRPEATMLHL